LNQVKQIDQTDRIDEIDPLWGAVRSRGGKWLLLSGVSTRGRRIFGGTGQGNRAEDGISVPGNKPVKQIAEGLHQLKSQEGRKDPPTFDTR
jgi:hypothetical protein